MLQDNPIRDAIRGDIMLSARDVCNKVAPQPRDQRRLCGVGNDDEVGVLERAAAGNLAPRAGANRAPDAGVS
jgi:hypothetical protein